jgi:class 3 adenylate cyclase
MEFLPFFVGLLGFAAAIVVVVAVLRYFPTKVQVSGPIIPAEEHSRRPKEEEPPDELSPPEIIVAIGRSIPSAPAADCYQDEVARRRELIQEHIRQLTDKIERGEHIDWERFSQATSLGSDEPLADLQPSRPTGEQHGGERARTQELIEERIRRIRSKINREEFSDAIDLAKKTLVIFGPDTHVSQLLDYTQAEIDARQENNEQTKDAKSAPREPAPGSPPVPPAISREYAFSPQPVASGPSSGETPPRPLQGAPPAQPGPAESSLGPSVPTADDLREEEGVRILERTLEVALAPAIPVLTPVELIALLRLPESASLKDLLLDEAGIGDLKKAIHKRNFGLEFPKMANGYLKSVDVTMRVVAPDFEPSQIEKIVRVQPASDCEEQVFLLTPKLVGSLIIQFDVLLGSVTLASRALRTRSEPSDRLKSASHKAVVSLFVKVDTTPVLEIAHILFMDIVGYSKLAIDNQQRVLRRLQEAVRACAEFTQASIADSLIRLPTGDGMALVFFQDALAPVRCAFELSQIIRGDPELRLRMGIHSGSVYRVDDINESKNVAGSGINVAQRVMDCGDAGHILVSKAVAEVLCQLSTWCNALSELGETEVKHGVRIHLFNLCIAEVGNPKLPQKLEIKAGSFGAYGSERTQGSRSQV